MSHRRERHWHVLGERKVVDTHELDLDRHRDHLCCSPGPDRQTPVLECQGIAVTNRSRRSVSPGFNGHRLVRSGAIAEMRERIIHIQHQPVIEGRTAPHRRDPVDLMNSAIVQRDGERSVFARRVHADARLERLVALAIVHPFARELISAATRHDSDQREHENPKTQPQHRHHPTLRRTRSNAKRSASCEAIGCTSQPRPKRRTDAVATHPPTHPRPAVGVTGSNSALAQPFLPLGAVNADRLRANGAE